MKINHITILVKDNKAAAKYYEEILELGKIKLSGENHYWISIGDIYLHLAAKSGEPIQNTFYHFAIEIDDLPAYLDKIKSRGVEIRQDGKQFFIHDLDGNMIELIDSKTDFFK